MFIKVLYMWAQKQCLRVHDGKISILMDQQTVQLVGSHNRRQWNSTRVRSDMK